MKKSERSKEKLIAVTTRLIEESGGDVRKVTSRAIAAETRVALGDINYHFGGKEKLVTECVQRIIGNVVRDFKPGEPYGGPRERLRAAATHVFEFLYAHPAVARISILGDLENYAPDCNSVGTQRGFAGLLPSALTAAERSLGAFVLTSAMQTAFLGGETVAGLLGFDLSTAAGRAAFVGALVDKLWSDGETRA